LLVTGIYKISERFPEFERYGLSSQIQRSAVSIPSNIAEGSGRRTNKDFSRFIDIAIASTCELETQLYIANNLGYIQDEKLKDIINEIEEIKKMMFVYQSRL